MPDQPQEARSAASIGDQLGAPDKRYFILCANCARKLEGDKTFMLALFGPQGLTDEDAVLLCVPWNDRATGFESQKGLCDGCNITVAIAPSSFWFLERWLKERSP